jgi:hypothetical protein
VTKWFFAFFLILALALAFTAGLRIDPEVLAEKLHMKPDPNVETLRKMGIDPGQIGFKSKPWCTFRSEDNLFKRIDWSAWIGPEMMKEASRKVSQMKKNTWSPGPAEVAESLATEGAAQARRDQLRAEAGLKDARDTRNAMQKWAGTSPSSQGTEETES